LIYIELPTILLRSRSAVTSRINQQQVSSFYLLSELNGPRLAGNINMLPPIEEALEDGFELFDIPYSDLTENAPPSRDYFYPHYDVLAKSTLLTDPRTGRSLRLLVGRDVDAFQTSRLIFVSLSWIMIAALTLIALLGFLMAAAIQFRTGNHLFSWEGLELSWTTRQMDQWYVQVDLGLEEGREADDSDDGRLDGFDERDDALTGTFEVRYAFSGEWRNYVGTRISAGDNDFGALAFILFGHRFGDRQDGGGTEAFFYATFASSDNLNRDFGVSPSEAAESGLAETDLSSGYRSAGLRLVDRRFVNEHIQIVSGCEFEYYSSDVQDSPIAREDYSVEVELGVLYHF
jgi:outer membrane protein